MSNTKNKDNICVGNEDKGADEKVQNELINIIKMLSIGNKKTLLAFAKGLIRK